MDINKNFVFVPIENGIFHYKLDILSYNYDTRTYTGKEEYYSGIASKYSISHDYSYPIATLFIDDLHIRFYCVLTDYNLLKDHIFNQLLKK